VLVQHPGRQLLGERGALEPEVRSELVNTHR
jgi:hypothetical protein